LLDPEKAIEYLEFIEPDSVIQKMLDEEESEYSKILNEYWAGYDPDPETVFNPLMAEYYNRIDYAFKEFRGIGKENGASTDRGMIYVRFGKPEKVERASNLQGHVTEAWFYNNPERKFIFVDKKGTGNFILVNG
jgi:GWxTD domain-containing protein